MNAPARAVVPNNLEAFWMPFTANRQFKSNPRMFVAAKGMYYETADGRQVLDGTAGLWCCNAGHGRAKIVEAVQRQVAELDYAPAFQMGHPKAFELASRLVQLTPAGHRPRLLHQLRLRGRRDRAQNRARLSTRAGRGRPLPADRARAGLSRRQFRRHLGRRHRLEPQDVRHAADRRRPHPAHPRSRPQRLFTRPAGAWRRAGRGPRASDPACTTPRPSPP